MTMRVASLNLRATPNRSIAKLVPLIDLLGEVSPDVVLLQECRAGWLDLVCAQLGLEGVRSNELTPQLAGLPVDGCAVAVKAPLSIITAAPVAPAVFDPAEICAWTNEPAPAGYEELPSQLAARFSARSLIAEISGADGPFAVSSLHATPGTGRYGPKPGRLVHEWKPFFHGGAALALSQLTLPFLFSIDANEPRSETPQSVAFHWVTGRSGSMKFASLLGLCPKHRGRDLLREQLANTGAPPASDSYLALTYTTHGGGAGGGRRFDSMWASPEFALDDFVIRYEDALAAGTDHALLIADLTLQPPARTNA